MAFPSLELQRQQTNRRWCCILGTAGHIDHGKSSLVRALTGTDPDRLPEEQARGMTIELGFAHLPLPGENGDDIDVGIVDVPGHERFIRTMVAGATGVDLGMLVVAADDGVMPQTREHVEILDLLGVAVGLVAISKVDMVSPERVAEVSDSVVALLQTTSLRAWPVVVCSAKTGQGLDDIRDVVRRLAFNLSERERSDVFRLAIDRVFTIHGRGTVVTGSVLSGDVAVGASLELQPVGLACKVREVQSHGKTVQDVVRGQRAALNLTGIDREQIERGMELATPGYLTPTRYVDARVRIVTRHGKVFLSHQKVRVSMGTREEMAVMVVIGGKSIAQGEEAFVQLRFSSPVVAAFGQRFILRNETAQMTIGGGTVVRPASRRIRPRHAEELDNLRSAASDDPYIRLTESARRAGFEPYSLMRYACETGLEVNEVQTLLRRLADERQTTSIVGRTVHVDVIEGAQQRALAYLQRGHERRPQESGIPKDKFIGWMDARIGAGIGREMFNRLEAAGRIVLRGPFVCHAAFRPAMSAEDAALLAALVKEITTAGFDPPTWTALKTTAALSRQRMKTLEELAKCDARLVGFAPQQYISVDAIERFKQAVRKVGAGRRFTLAEVRDALKLSRRVVQPLLEYLDRVGFTKRVGDERVLLEHV